MSVIIPIGSGKGGVGKSFIAANLGALTARRWAKVVLVDLDLGASNLHTLLGIKNPKNGLDRLMDKSVKSLEDAAISTIVPNLSFISTLHCSMEIANLYYAQKQKIIRSIHALPFDYILLDLGAGTNYNTLDFFLTSQEGIVVCTPEPTSIENAFRFIKAVYLRKLRHIIKQHDFNAALKDKIASTAGSETKSSDIIEWVLKYDPNRENYLRRQLKAFNFGIVINQSIKASDNQLGHKMALVCSRHFYSTFQFLGVIGFDGQIRESVISKSIYTDKYPHTSSTQDLKMILDKIFKSGQTDAQP